MATAKERRLRWTITEQQFRLLHQVAEAMGVDDKTAYTMAASIGLRFLDLSVVHPMSPGISQAVDRRVDQSVRETEKELKSLKRSGKK